MMRLPRRRRSLVRQAPGGESPPHVCCGLMITKSRNVRILCVGMAIGASLGLARGVLADKPAAAKDDLPWQDARMLADVLERVKHDYVNPVDDHQLLPAAIRGMVSSLDPYSAYLDRAHSPQLKISTS